MRLPMVAMCAFTVLFSDHAVNASAQDGPANAAESRLDNSVEAIYVVRSVLQSGVPKSTEFCNEARTGFGNAGLDNQYVFRSIATRPSDGLVVDASVEAVGTMHACFGMTPDSGIVNFYGEGRLAEVNYRGNGECRTTRDYPEPGVNSIRRFLDLSGLPEGYQGGRLTTNSINTPARLIGETTKPPGYVQSSVATVRLWKRRE